MDERETSWTNGDTAALWATRERVLRIDVRHVDGFAYLGEHDARQLHDWLGAQLDPVGPDPRCEHGRLWLDPCWQCGRQYVDGRLVQDPEA